MSARGREIAARSLLAALSLSIALGACGCSESRAPLEADLLLLDGRVFTADPDRPWAEALAIRGDRIVEVGASADLRARAPSDARVLALGGRLVVPGINDAHTHLNPRPEGMRLVGFPEDPVWGEVLSAVAFAAQSAQPGLWLYGTIGGLTLDEPGVDRAALDALAPRNPVLLSCWSGHGVIANSEALRRLGIAEDQPDPPGGFYVRRPGTTTLSGVAHEYAGFRLALGAKATAEEAIAAVRAYDQSARELGITTLQMMTLGDWAAEPAATLQASGARARWRFIDFTLVSPADW